MPLFVLFAAEGHAVRALLHSRVGLVGADLDMIQGAVVCAVAVVHALLYCAGDTFILFALIHRSFSSKKVLAYERLSLFCPEKCRIIKRL